MPCRTIITRGRLLYQQERPTVSFFQIVRRLFSSCFPRVSIRFSHHTWVSTESSLASESDTRHRSRVWKNQTIAAQITWNYCLKSSLLHHTLSLSIFNSWFRLNYQLCERNTTKVCRMMLAYRTKIPIQYANCATGVCVCVCDHALSSRGSDRHRRWGGRSRRGPIRICTRLLHGRAHATQFLRAGDLPPTSAVLCFDLSCLAPMVFTWKEKTWEGGVDR